MAFLDIFKGKKKKVDEKLKRPPKGALKGPEKPKEKPQVEDKKEKPLPRGKASALASQVLLSLHTTEKTTLSAERGAYVFRVAPRANKIMIKRAIEEFYGFKPRKVSITNMPSKIRLSRGRAGVRPGFKKATVYLKEGDKIDIA